MFAWLRADLGRPYFFEFSGSLENVLAFDRQRGFDFCGCSQVRSQTRLKSQYVEAAGAERQSVSRSGSALALEFVKFQATMRASSRHDKARIVESGHPSCILSPDFLDKRTGPKNPPPVTKKRR